MVNDPTNDPRFSPRPIILITGATGAVGYGICLRLLYQLSQPIQPDLWQYSNGIGSSSNTLDGGVSEEERDYQSVYATPNGLTLLISSRNEQKGEETGSKLIRDLRRNFKAQEKLEERDQSFYSYIDRLTGQVETLSFESYRSKWLENLRIEGISIDLYQARTVVRAVKEIEEKFGYLTHLILNAGGGPFVGLDWPRLIKAFLCNMVKAVTYPDYMLESKTVLETDDKIPETWQLNVFSHYLLAKESLRLLSNSSDLGLGRSRIVWTGSLDGRREYFDRSDYQSLRPGQAYQSSKYQIEIVGQAFEKKIEEDGKSESVTSVVAHPGVVAGNMFLPIIGRAMDVMMKWIFYFTRTILGSPHHLINAYSAALVWSFVCLSEKVEIKDSIRYGAQCDRFGNPNVVKEEIGPDEELVERSIDQQIVIEACESWIVALKRLWNSEEKNDTKK